LATSRARAGRKNHLNKPEGENMNESTTQSIDFAAVHAEHAAEMARMKKMNRKLRFQLE
jgi:hypothetical protein